MGALLHCNRFIRIRIPEGTFCAPWIIAVIFCYTKLDYVRAILIDNENEVIVDGIANSSNKDANDPATSESIGKPSESIGKPSENVKRELNETQHRILDCIKADSEITIARMSEDICDIYHTGPETFL